MATYRGIKGFKVQSLASDPTGPEGQVWYNTATDLLKYQVMLGAWASGNDLIDDRPAAGSWGTQTAAAYVCGSPREQKTELFDGTSWTEGNDTQTARNYNMAAGSPSAGLCFGGGVGGSPWATNASEEYDGTSWATGNTMGSQQSMAAAFGSQTAAVSATGGGAPGAAPSPTASEEYDGTTWAAGGTVNSGRVMVRGSGTQASGIMGPGETPPGAQAANVEEYDGTSWAAVNSTNVGRSHYGMSKDGLNTSAIIFCGITPGGSNQLTVEEWNGTSWTETTNVTTGTQELSGAGTGSSALKMGGNAPTAPGGAVELWSYATPSVKTVTVS